METLSDPVRIIALIKRLQEQRVLVRIIIEDHPQEFTSAVINVSAENGYLMLDELKPGTGLALMKTAGNIKIRAQLEGVVIGFSSPILEIGEQDAIAYYKIPIPALLDYHQRRQSVRISLSAANPLSTVLTPKNGSAIRGSIADLSIGGLRVRFDEALPATIQAGENISCSFVLPPDNKQTFSCDLIIRVIRHKHDRLNAAFLGGQFVDITKPQERLIERTVMLLQRAAQQKRNS